MDSLVQDWLLNKLFFPVFFWVFNFLGAIYLFDWKGNKVNAEDESHGIGVSRGQAAEAVQSKLGIAQSPRLRHSPPELASPILPVYKQSGYSSPPSFMGGSGVPPV